MSRSRVIAYPVHPSGLMLEYRDKEAALYHLSSLLWTRRYEDAAAMMQVPYSLLTPSSREARFTASPMTV